MLFKRKDQLKIDLGDLKDEKEKLASYLQAHLRINTTPIKNGLTINPEDTSPQELKRAVNKFIYHQKLNGTYWVSLEMFSVRINKFKSKKKPKTKKQKRTPQHETLTQSWGLG